jgi:proline racemase
MVEIRKQDGGRFLTKREAARVVAHSEMIRNMADGRMMVQMEDTEKENKLVFGTFIVHVASLKQNTVGQER